jgi:ribonuclease P protein subunit POP4
VQAVQQLLGLELYGTRVEGTTFRLAKHEVSLADKEKRKDKRKRKFEKGALGRRISLEIAELAQDATLTLASVQPLHRLWNMYIDDLLAEEGEGRLLKLLRADLHGAWLQVLHCKERGQEGLEGIVVKETLQTFVVVT